jgi:DNA-binding protein HU-beta
LSNKVTFSDLVGRIADETGASRRVIRDLLKEISTVTNEGLLRDGRVNIPGLGIFKLKWRDVRKGINPKTSKTIQIPAQNRVYFKSEASLRRFIDRRHRHMKPEIIGEYIKPEISFWRKRVTLGWTVVLLVILLFMLAGFFSLFRPSFEPVPPASETILRYKIPIEEVAEREEEIQPVPQPDILPTPAEKPGIVHNTQQADSLWSIAKLFYADPYLWPNIFRVNIGLIEDPDTLEVGISIHVPRLEGAVGSLTQKDIMDITEGYIQVYLVYRRLGKINARPYLWVAKQCNVPEVLEKYEDRIDKSDWDFVLRIKGSVRIR